MRRMVIGLGLSLSLLACSEEPAETPCGGFCPLEECVDNMCIRTRSIADMMVVPDVTVDMLAVIDMAPPAPEFGPDMALEPDAAPPKTAEEALEQPGAARVPRDLRRRVRGRAGGFVERVECGSLAKWRVVVVRIGIGGGIRLRAS